MGVPINLKTLHAFNILGIEGLFTKSPNGKPETQSFLFWRTDLLKLHEFLLCFRGIKRPSSRILTFLILRENKEAVQLLNKVFETVHL